MSCLSLTKEESLQRTFSAEDCIKITNIYRRPDAEDFSKCINGRVCKKCIRIDFQHVNDQCKVCITRAHSNRPNKTINHYGYIVYIVDRASYSLYQISLILPIYVM